MKLHLLLIIALFTFINSTYACDVPVFRYALERWNAERFLIKVTVSVDKKLSNDEALAIKLLRAHAEGEGNGNYSIKVIKAQVPLAQLEVLAPSSQGGQRLWEGFLRSASAKTIIESPSRKKLSEQILAGNSLSWLILLPEGQQKIDAKTRSKISEWTKKYLSQVKLSKKIILMDEKERQQKSSDLENVLRSSIPLTLNSSMVIVPASENEEFFRASLLGGMNSIREALLIPVFGRGRFLEGINLAQANEKWISEQVNYICGACTCTMKSENRGKDLMLTVAWGEHMMDGLLIKEVEPPKELSGASALGVNEANISQTNSNRDSASKQVENPQKSGNSLLLMLIACGGGLLLFLLFFSKKLG